MTAPGSPVVSCVIPVAGERPELADALASVFLQGVPAEVIVVENGPTAGAEAIVRAAAVPDGVQVHYHHLDEAGANPARRFGQAQARAPFVQFLDSDDVLGEGKWRRQLAHLERSPQVDVSLSATLREREDGSGGTNQVDPRGRRAPTLANFLWGRVHPVTGAALWRRARLDVIVWPAVLKNAQDWESHLRALIAGLRFDYCPDTSFTIRVGARERITHLGVGDKAYGHMMAILLNLTPAVMARLSLAERAAALIWLLRLRRVCRRHGVAPGEVEGEVRRALHGLVRGIVRT